MSQRSFEEFIRLGFNRFLAECGFNLHETHVNGRHHCAIFLGDDHRLEISFEPGDNLGEVYIFKKGEASLAAMDDPTSCLRLSDLNSKYGPRVKDAQRLRNSEYFGTILPDGEEELHLLALARRLRLVLPHYLADK